MINVHILDIACIFNHNTYLMYIVVSPFKLSATESGHRVAKGPLKTGRSILIISRDLFQMKLHLWASSQAQHFFAWGRS